jgi:small GTP-binding protein
LNALLGERRAIVSDTAGTTRDFIEESVEIGGWPVRLVDTAGLRESADAIEGEGVARARDLMEKADIVLNLTPADGDPTGGMCGTVAVIEVLSKCDLIANSEDYGSRYHSAVSRPAIATQEESTGDGFRTQSGGAGMHRSAAEGRFGVAEPAGRASVCARTSTVGVFPKPRRGRKGSAAQSKIGEPPKGRVNVHTATSISSRNPKIALFTCGRALRVRGLLPSR